MSFEQMHVTGLEAFAAMVPDGKDRIAEIFRSAPALGEMAVGTVYGHLHHRRALDPRLRESVALAAIISSGMVGAPLAVHLRTALAAGLAPAEIVEVVLETAAFGGFPRAVSALPAVEKALEGSGSVIPPRRSPREVVLDSAEQFRRKGDAGPDDDSLPGAWTAWLDPCTKVTVHTVAPDQAVAIFAPQEAPSRATSVLHLQIEDDRIAEATWLTPQASGGHTPGADVGAGSTVALSRLFDDLRIVGRGPAAQYAVPDPDLLDQVEPLQDALQAGVCPSMIEVDGETAVAVFSDPRGGVTLAIGQLADGAIRRVSVVSPSRHC